MKGEWLEGAIEPLTRERLVGRQLPAVILPLGATKYTMESRSNDCGLLDPFRTILFVILEYCGSV